MSGPGVGVGALLVALLVLPFVAALCSGYVKAAVVLAVLRGALSGVPPRSVAAAVAVLLAAFTIAPVAEQAYRAAAPALATAGSDRAALVAAADAAREPLRAFLARHAPERERRSFLELARRLRSDEPPDTITDRDILVLTPAFVFAELRAAFQIGFLLLLPFLVVELVVSTVLAALGLHALDARVVSLPFKLLLFVMADGWHLLARGLLLGYA